MTLTTTAARTCHTPHRVVLTAASVALLCAGLAGCSGGRDNTSASTPTSRQTSPPPASATPATSRTKTPAAADASSCGLVTAKDVGAATGTAMGPGAGAGNICSYSATADPSTVVYLQLYTDAQSMGPAKAIEAGSEHLAGLGDDAFWAPGGIIFVQKGSRGFTISTPSLALTSRNAPQPILTLAAAALARL
jgi:hypothetical protein